MEYCQYVSKVREYSRTMELREAVERAVTECIREGILEDFLKKNRAEVIHMSIYEFDEEKYRKALRQESWEEGREFGWDEGREFGLTEGRKEGRAEGLAEGHAEGIKEKEKNIAFRLFAKKKPLEDVSDTLGISMDYALDLHQQYEHRVHEESNYGEK